MSVLQMPLASDSNVISVKSVTYVSVPQHTHIIYNLHIPLRDRNAIFHFSFACRFMMCVPGEKTRAVYCSIHKDCFLSVPLHTHLQSRNNVHH